MPKNRWAVGKKMFDAELNSFKTSIDLRAYAAGQGYQLDAKASWRGTSVMRHPLSNDKVIIKRGMDGHFVYFSVRDDRDNGSIIDFVQNRQRLSLGAVRKELRPWINQPPVAVPSFPTLPRTEKDRMKVEGVWARMQDAVDGHIPISNRNAPYRPPYSRWSGLPDVSASMTRATLCFRISTPKASPAMNSRMSALPALHRVAARPSGCRTNCLTITSW